MGTLQQIHQWSLAHHPRWLVVLRIGLGIALFFKGITFLMHAPELQTAMEGSILQSQSEWLAIGITWAHLLGGFLIIIGLLTRWAVLLQIPILFGAVVLINLHKGFLYGGSELFLSAVLLVLLIFFLVEGGGPLSLDNYFRKHPTLM